MSRRPPRIARGVLRRLLPGKTRDEVLADLEAIWRERAASRGRAGADRWYWGQLVSALAPSLAGALDVGNGTGGGSTMESIRRDVAYAWTQLTRHPGIGIVVVATLALGIGSTTAIFSVVNGVLLAPLPYGEPAELVMVTSRAGGSSLPRYLSGPDALEMKEAVGSLAELALLGEVTVGPMTRVERPEHVLTVPASWNLFHVLGVDVAVGRNFVPEDGVPVAQTTQGAQSPQTPPTRSAIISHALWERAFGSDPETIGRVVHVWGGPSEIVGVLPEGLRIDLPAELNIPPDLEVVRAIWWDVSQSSRERPWYRTIGRLETGASLRRAEREVEAFAERQRAEHAHHAAEGTEFDVRSLESAVAAPLRAPLWVLMGAVTMVLLIACANVANLLLARGSARASEMAVRMSLGAGGRRLVRQLLTESALLAGLGAAGGVLLASVGVDVLHAIRPDDLHRLEGVRLDGAVLAFTVVCAIAATLLAGLLPAVHTARSGLASRLGTRGGAAVGKRSRNALVATEVALSVVLLVGAGLLIRTFSELQRMPLGFEPEQVLTVTATQTGRPHEERRAYEAELLRVVREVPGVAASGIVFPLPMNGVYDRSAEYAMDGRETDPASWTPAYFRTISPTYFEAMGLQMRLGRTFVDADETYDVPIVILDEKLAAREFGGRDPVGRPLWVRGMEGDTLRATVVGVVEHAPQWDHRDARPTMYFPRVFYQSHEVSVVAKVQGDPVAVAPRLSDAIRSVDPTFPADLVPMEHFVRDRLARSRFLLILMQIFGVLALGLSAVGLYGVLSYSVRQRNRELGLRLALGARGRELTGSVVWSGVRLTGLGIGAGLVGALAMGHALRAQLFRVGSADPLTLTAAAALVLAVAVAASLLPAMRAARVDPVVALQEE